VQSGFQETRLIKNLRRKCKYGLYSAVEINLHDTYTVFQKSDAKIKITITTAHPISINYPFSILNYRLSGTNVANFNKIHHMVSEQQLF